MSQPLRIDIGGGKKIKVGYTNLDQVHGEGDWRRRAQDIPWPAEDNSVEAIHASHVMEHIPAGEERMAVMNEAWRVLQPNRVFEIIVPLLFNSAWDTITHPANPTAIPQGVNWQAIADPTHVSYWCLESFKYFDGSFSADADYGMKLWQTLALCAPRVIWEGYWAGTPVKTGEAQIEYAMRAQAEPRQT